MQKPFKICKIFSYALQSDILFLRNLRGHAFANNHCKLFKIKLKIQVQEFSASYSNFIEFQGRLILTRNSDH